MSAFRRIFRYIWPQWPRITIVVFSAIIVAALLSLSFMTIIPLLKVMMEDEGLHGWIDRKACEYHYGLQFNVPKTIDISHNPALAYQLLITNVKEKSLAEAAGIRPADVIVGLGNQPTSNGLQIPFAKLLEEMATTRKEQLTVHFERMNKEGALEDTYLQLNTHHNEAYVQTMQWNSIERNSWAIKNALINRTQWALSFLPRQQTNENKIRAVVFIISAMAVITIIRCLAKFYQGYLAEKIVQMGISHLREDVFGHLTDMPVGFFADERPSDSVSRIVRDTTVMGQAIKIMLGKALREPLNALFMLAAAALLNWQLTLIFLCGAPVVLVLLSAFGKKMKRATRKFLITGSQILAKLQGTMSGLEIVKVYNQQKHEREGFKAINRKLLKQLLKISRVEAATNPVLEVLGMIAGSVALIVGVHWVTQGQIDSPQFLALLILLGASAESVRKTSDIWNKIQQANAAAERVFAVLDRPIEFEQPNAASLPPLKNKLEFRNVVFTYPASNKPVLREVNLTISAGHNVAIVGPNGSGKTTLAKLIPRFYDPDTGQVLIDGQDIRNVTLFSLRSQIGLVTQNVVTFNDTIAANIAYGKSGATRQEIISAAKRAYAHEFIEFLPDQYNTVIGEQGIGLSGGQLQRIVIARAILKNPPILIFDEATSQVDADSEAKIHKAIEEIMQNRTTLIIAHRFSTVISADLIVVIDNGQIIAQGQHDELMQTCQLYQGLYDTQLVRA